MLDVAGPYLFYPLHCFGNRKRGRFSSPVIAYIETGTEVEKMVVSQLEALFATQREALEASGALSALSFLSNFLSTDFIRQEEF